jgi:uncharacterized protein YkwD
MPEPGDLGQVRAAVFCLINRERARDGESPLHGDARLRLAAQEHSAEMVSRDYFKHTGPDGQTLLQRLRASGYLHSSQRGYAIGENIAWGTVPLATPEATVAEWMASAEHRANILNRRFRDTGIGVVPGAPGSLAEDRGAATYTQDFGAILPG